MTTRNHLGGVIHTYQRYDPTKFPSPTQPPPDLVSGAFEHMLAFGSMRELPGEEVARAVRIDPSQIQGFGPSIDALIAMLLERKRKILEKYETDSVRKEAKAEYRDLGEDIEPPKQLEKKFRRAFEDEQIRELERLWYAAGDDRSAFARALVQLVGRLGDKYQIDELAAKYAFVGRKAMSVEQAIEIKEELEKIDELLKQLEEARDTAQIGVVDMDALAEFAEPGDVKQLGALQQQVQDYLRELAERQGLESAGGNYQLTPKAYRIFQGRLLEHIFSSLEASRTGRHQGEVVGEGAVELQQTKPYEFGDSVANMDVPGSLTNAMLREAGESRLPIRMKPDDILIHKTRNTPKCATAVLMDMSGSMRYDGQYINVKRMALALDGLIHKEYPGDFLQFIQVYSFAQACHRSEIINLMPKPVTVHDPVVRLRADMSREEISEYMVPPHFTNIQHGLQLARQFLATRDTPNRQIILITDGLPTAHFEQHELFLLYPPDTQTETATMREGQLCHREGITINIFLVPSWSQSEEDIRFAYRLAESTTGRVVFTAGRDLDRFVVWDYLNRRREIVA
ncbi:MAG: VWA domain-containing protein [Pirellulales bacterium]|nr:VWA domain-containing protein [Pirellulales bacterium]